MISDTILALKGDSLITYDRKLIRQLRALVNKDGKIVVKKPARDDRAISFCGAIAVSPQHYRPGSLAVGDYVTFGDRRG